MGSHQLGSAFISQKKRKKSKKYRQIGVVQSKQKNCVIFFLQRKVIQQKNPTMASNKVVKS